MASTSTSGSLHHPTSDLGVRLRARLLERGADPMRVDALLSDAPDPWWEAGTEDQLVDDVGLLLEPLPGDQVRLRILPPTEPSEPWDLTVVARDRVGLLATTAAVAARHRLSIIAARVATWVGSGVALQRIAVVPTELPSSGEPDWPFIGQHLHAALQGAEVAGRRTTVPAGVRITEVESTGNGRWMVGVTGPDEVGLLAEVAALLAGIGADVVSAVLTSEDGTAVDRFLVRLGTPEAESRLRALQLANRGVASV